MDRITEFGPNVIWVMVGRYKDRTTTDKERADYWRNAGYIAVEYHRAPATASVSAPSGAVVPAPVLAWRDAYASYVAATAAYNAHLKYVRENCPFGTSVDEQYQAMERAKSRQFGLMRPMFDSLETVTAASSGAVDSEASRAAYEATYAAHTGVSDVFGRYGDDQDGDYVSSGVFLGWITWQLALAWQASQNAANAAVLKAEYERGWDEGHIFGREKAGAAVDSTRWTQAEIDQLRVTAEKLKARFNPPPREIDDAVAGAAIAAQKGGGNG